MPFMHSVKTALGRKVIAAIAIDKHLPEIVEGVGSTSQLGSICTKYGVKNPLIVTDKDLVALGLVLKVTSALTASNLRFKIYDEVLPDPTEEMVVSGAKMYNVNRCDGIIAFGGGSSIDCAKIIGAYVVKPQTVKEFMAGDGVGNNDLPPLIAIPTTAGTGSETTFAAVIRDEALQVKYLLVDLKILPKVAVLDAELLRNLPKGITAATGMDAMTHAVEAYTNVWFTPKVKKWSSACISKLFEFLIRAYENGSEDLEARQQVSKAAFEAGVAISLGNVGYVHAIAHTVGGRFHTPHGVANAMILPHVLEFLGETIHERLAELAVLVKLGTASEKKSILANKFIQSIKDMHSKMNMPKTVKGLKLSNVKSVAERALLEAHGQLYSFWKEPKAYMKDGGYPVPKIMSQAECEKILIKLLDPEKSKL